MPRIEHHVGDELVGSDNRIRADDEKRPRHEQTVNRDSTETGDERPATRVVQERERRGQDQQGGVVFGGDGQAGQEARRRQVPIGTGLGQLDDGEKRDEDHARHRDVGHTEMRIAHVQEGEREEAGRCERDGTAEQMRPMRKISQTLAMPAAALSRRAAMRSAGRCARAASGECASTQA